MKVWLAWEGWYSDRRVRAVCSTKKLALEVAEGEDNVTEHTVLTTKPRARQLHVASAVIARSPHPTLWGDIYDKKHFHIGDPNDCSICNPGHVEEGECPGCKPDVTLHDASWTVNVWDDSYDEAVSPPKVKRSRDSITSVGGNKDEVQTALARYLDRNAKKLGIER